MPELKDLQLAHAAALSAVKAKMDETKGRETTPVEEEELDKGFKAVDEAKGAIEKAENSIRRETNLKNHLDYQSKGTGHVDLATGTVEDGGSGSQEGKWYGIQREGKFQPIFHEEQVSRQPYLKTAFNPGYRKAYGEYLRGGFSEMSHSDQQVLLQGKALSEGTNTAGGYLVPIDFLTEVIQRLPGMSVFQDRARVITTSRDRVEAPRIKSNTSYPSMYTSAVVFTMVSETPSASTGLVDPIFESVPITVNTAKLETLVSRNLISDAQFDIAGYLAEEYRVAQLLGKDQKFIAGTGLSEPLGIIKDTDITTITSGTANVLQADDLKNLIYDLYVQYQTGAALGMSLDALKKIRKLKDGDGNYIWSPGNNHGLDDGPPATIEGFPYIVTDFLPTVATGNIPIFFGNPRYYWIVNRLDMSMQILQEVYAEQNQLAYLAFMRFGGHVVVPEAFRTLTVA